MKNPEEFGVKIEIPEGIKISDEVNRNDQEESVFAEEQQKVIEELNQMALDRNEKVNFETVEVDQENETEETPSKPTKKKKKKVLSVKEGDSKSDLSQKVDDFKGYKLTNRKPKKRADVPEVVESPSEPMEEATPEEIVEKVADEKVNPKNKKRKVLNIKPSDSFSDLSRKLAKFNGDKVEKTKARRSSVLQDVESQKELTEEVAPEELVEKVVDEKENPEKTNKERKKRVEKTKGASKDPANFGESETFTDSHSTNNFTVHNIRPGLRTTSEIAVEKNDSWNKSEEEIRSASSQESLLQALVSIPKFQENGRDYDSASLYKTVSSALKNPDIIKDLDLPETFGINEKVEQLAKKTTPEIDVKKEEFSIKMPKIPAEELMLSIPRVPPEVFSFDDLYAYLDYFGQIVVERDGELVKYEKGDINKIVERERRQENPNLDDIPEDGNLRRTVRGLIERENVMKSLEEQEGESKESIEEEKGTKFLTRVKKGEKVPAKKSLWQKAKRLIGKNRFLSTALALMLGGSSTSTDAGGKDFDGEMDNFNPNSSEAVKMEIPSVQKEKSSGGQEVAIYQNEPKDLDSVKSSIDRLTKSDPEQASSQIEKETVDESGVMDFLDSFNVDVNNIKNAEEAYSVVKNDAGKYRRAFDTAVNIPFEAGQSQVSAKDIHKIGVEAFNLGSKLKEISEKFGLNQADTNKSIEDMFIIAKTAVLRSELMSGQELSKDGKYTPDDLQINWAQVRPTNSVKVESTWGSDTSKVDKLGNRVAEKNKTSSEAKAGSLSDNQENSSNSKAKSTKTSFGGEMKSLVTESFPGSLFKKGKKGEPSILQDYSNRIGEANHIKNEREKRRRGGDENGWKKTNSR